MPTRNYSQPPTRTIGGIEYYSIEDSSFFTGLSHYGLLKRIRKHNESYTKVLKYEIGGGSARYYKKEDLVRLVDQVRVVD